MTARPGKILAGLLHMGSLVVCKAPGNGAAPTNVRSGRGGIETLDGRLEQRFGAEGSKPVIVFPALPMHVPAAVVRT